MLACSETSHSLLPGTWGLKLPNGGSWIMQGYELTDFEWGVIAPLLPNKPRGVPRVDDRRVLNGIFWVLRTGAPAGSAEGGIRSLYHLLQPLCPLAQSRGLGSRDGRRQPGLRWRCADDRQQLGAGPSACRQLKKSHPDRCMGRSRGGLTTKIHALTDAHGLTIELVLTPGQAGDCPVAAGLLGHLRKGTIVLADKAYDADWLRRQIEAAGAAPNIPPMVHRRWKPCFRPVLYRARNRIERFFNRIKHFRRLATRYEKHAANFLAMLKLAATHLWLRHNESVT